MLHLLKRSIECEELQKEGVYDDFVAGAAIHSAKIVTDINPIDINIYSSGDSTRPFMVHSSLNPEVYFAEDSSGVYRTLIEGLNKLLEKK